MKTYQIYDGENSSLLDDHPIIEAETGKEAIEEYLKKTNRNYKLKMSAGNDVLFSATPFVEKGGMRYKNGNSVWYKKV